MENIRCQFLNVQVGTQRSRLSRGSPRRQPTWRFPADTWPASHLVCPRRAADQGSERGLGSAPATAVLKAPTKESKVASAEQSHQRKASGQ